ncbi:MAG: toxin secretion, membrane fusion protein, partial [Chloroflexota bacterium]
LEIKKVVTKVKFGQKKTDAAYWRKQSYSARLAALEEIRQEYHRWRYGAEPGFQRVYTIVKR